MTLLAWLGAIISVVAAAAVRQRAHLHPWVSAVAWLLSAVVVTWGAIIAVNEDLVAFPMAIIVAALIHLSANYRTAQHRWLQSKRRDR